MFRYSEIQTWNICLCLTYRWLLVVTETKWTLLTLIEICSPEVQQGLANAKLMVQTLIPEVYRIYEANKEGVLRSPWVSVCPAFRETILISDKDNGKVFLARLHYPVDVTEVVTGSNKPSEAESYSMLLPESKTMFLSMTVSFLVLRCNQ